ncbi:hypothetical protein [Actinacidiphila oryziradicis]|uniref:Uncharacterized protein n=1 Tax=Actinacidiphila oryziradicis TaxID=2571141 RepID=A0A4U0RMD5_9ACTN|nr:hypothetical protein [Actinacidiphila oryziradicis]TJZ96252.1 hypothetical protein FCI23_51335 [Actinacidiphila oryziradicis]
MCGLLDGYPQPIRVGSFDVGSPQNLHVTTFTGLFGNVHASQYNLLSCNLAADRAVLTATYNSIVALAVVSLAKQKVLFEQNYPDTPNVVTAAVVAPNGLNLAIEHAVQPVRPSQSPALATCHSTQRSGQPLKICNVAPLATAPPQVPTSVDLYKLIGTPRSIGRIDDRAVAGWSGDGSRLIAETPNGRGSFSGFQVLRVSDGHVVWQTAENLSGETSAPGVTSVVVQTYDVPHKKTTIWIVDALGRPKRLEMSGQLVL